jgi:ABC-2 type transport system ATP-binding protein
MSALAIHTHGLSRVFPAGHGVRDLDLSVPQGCVYGFIGPNGAGKTITIRLLLGLLRVQRGSITVLGQSQLGAPLAGVGALVESPSLYPHLSGSDNLEVTRRLLGGIERSRIEAVLERVGLAADGRRRVREYSLGMRQRLGLALALLARPRLLILDEPSNGLNPAGIQDMRVLLRSLVKDDGLSVFVSSHLLSEVEQIADHVGVLHAGRLRYQGSLQALRERLPSCLELHCEPVSCAAQLLEQLGCTVQRTTSGVLLVQRSVLSDSELNRRLVEQGIEVAQVYRPAVSLERVFFDLTREPSA